MRRVCGGGGGGSITGIALRRAGHTTSRARARRTGRYGASRRRRAMHDARRLQRDALTRRPQDRRNGNHLVNINPGPAIPLRGIGFVAPQPFTFAWSGAARSLRDECAHGPPAQWRTAAAAARRGSKHARYRLQLHGPGRHDREDAEGLGRAQPSRRPVRGDAVRRIGDGVLGLLQRWHSDFVGALYTLDYEAASAGQTLTVSWVENADNCMDFRCDNVSIHAVALSGPGGGGGDADPPVLFAAVPNASSPPNSTGVAGLVEQDGLPAGTAFRSASSRPRPATTRRPRPSAPRARS